MQNRQSCSKGALTLIFILVYISLSLVCCSVEQEQQIESQRSELIQPGKWWEKLPRSVYATLERIDTNQEWFEVYKLTEGTYAIYEPFQFEEAISYVVLGEEKAAVIDTGTGIGDLKQAVGELTDLPLSVINTHTHWDHIGDNHQFDEIVCYNHPECIDKLVNGVPNARLRRNLTGDSIWKPLPQDLDPNTWEIPSVKPTSLLEDGDVVDLGERILEVIYTPGHSPGSICLLDKKNRLLFIGDTFFPGPLYAYPEDVNLDDYISSIDRLKNRIDEYDYLCSGHNDPWVKSEVILRVAQAFEEILAGRGEFKEDQGIRRYSFDGFDVLIRTDMILE